MTKKNDWKGVDRSAGDDGHRKAGAPPDVDDLIAYSRGTLPPADVARVREQLVLYPELARAMAVSPEEPPEVTSSDPYYVSDETMDGDWIALQERITASIAAPKPLHVVGPVQARGGVNPAWRISAVAAALAAIISGGLLIRARSEQERLFTRIATPSAPDEQLLLPDGSRGPVVELDPTPLATSADAILLVAPLINQTGYATYRVAILDAAVEPARVLWTVDGLRRRDNDTLQVLVPRTFLKAGRYQLVTYGLSGHSPIRLARFTFRAR